MKDISTLSYSSFANDNLGDEIQTIAAERCLEKLGYGIGEHIPREELSQFSSDDPKVVLLNGWFTHNPSQVFPVSENLIPLYYSFHLCAENADIILSEKNLESFKKYQPIGCRDRETMKYFEKKGIEAFFSKCLTLTLDKREKDPENGKVFLVDSVYQFPIPEKIRRGSIVVHHGDLPENLSMEKKEVMAKELLNRYKKEAKLVITSRLHAALPCLAMGIPVIFVRDIMDKEKGRVGVYEDVGGSIRYYTPSPKDFFLCSPYWFLCLFIKASFALILRILFRKKKLDYLSLAKRVFNPLKWKMSEGKIDWDNPDVLDLEEEKKKIINGLREQIERQILRS